MSLEAKLFWEILPIVLAFIAIFYCGFKGLVSNNKNAKVGSLLSIFAAFLMLSAQVSWSWTVYVQNNILGTDNANIMWTAFNSLVMLVFIYTSYWTSKHE